MAVFPQLTSNGLSQFPIVKRRCTRTVVNTAADGTSVKLADGPGASLEWELAYGGLSDGELAALQQFFTAMEGTLNGFTFADPSANLLAWTEQLNNAVWQAGPLLQVSGGVADPNSGTGAWLATNSGEAPQSLTQTLNLSGSYTYCFSIYVKANQPTTVTMLIGSGRADRQAGTGWNRIVFTATGDPTASAVTFGLELPEGAAVYVFGPQVETQPGASVYKVGQAGGVYENARFREDRFSYTSTDVNRHSVTLRVFYANHL